MIGKRPTVRQKVWRGVRELGVTEIGGVGEQSTLSGTGRRESELDIELGNQFQPSPRDSLQDVGDQGL